LALAGAALLLLLGRLSAEVVDCLVAVVNGQPITLTDIRIADGFGLERTDREGRIAERLYSILEKVVDQKVVVQFAGANVKVSEADVQSALGTLLDEIGPEEVQRKLGEFGLDLDDVTRYLEEKLVFQRIIDLRFSRAVTVSLREMEDYYQRVYASAEARPGLQPEPMIALLQEIEARIRQDKIRAQAALWIRSLRGQAEIEMKYDWLRKISPSKE
jgi:hypothetical protein